jgi:hypothetical protein
MPMLLRLIAPMRDTMTDGAGTSDEDAGPQPTREPFDTPASQSSARCVEAICRRAQHEFASSCFRQGMWSCLYRALLRRVQSL